MTYGAVLKHVSNAKALWQELERSRSGFDGLMYPCRAMVLALEVAMDLSLLRQINPSLVFSAKENISMIHAWTF